MHWEKLLKYHAHIKIHYPQYASMLSTLEELIMPENTDDKYVFFGSLLRTGNEIGLITSSEYYDIRTFLANLELA